MAPRTKARKAKKGFQVRVITLPRHLGLEASAKSKSCSPQSQQSRGSKSSI